MSRIEIRIAARHLLVAIHGFAAALGIAPRRKRTSIGTDQWHAAPESSHPSMLCKCPDGPDLIDHEPGCEWAARQCVACTGTGWCVGCGGDGTSGES